MRDLFDYLMWRGDILFSQLPPNNVDALIFSALSYIDYDDIVPSVPEKTISLRDAAKKVLELPDQERKFRVKKDLDLLSMAAETERFGSIGLCYYKNIFDIEKETQFAAITYILDDESAFLTFRGTDKTIIGWKEDFNMAYQNSIPAQRLARAYVQHFAMESDRMLRVGGHSKGGNMAIYAASTVDENIQDRILEVFNQDGPGFRDYMLEDEGYLRLIPKIHTFLPQSSIFGILMVHKEPCTIIKSRYVGIMQHDPYNWEVMGKDFIILEELAPGAQFMDKTMDEWLQSMTNEERNEFVDTLFDLVMTKDTVRPRDILKPQNILTYFKTWHMDEERRKKVGTELAKFVDAAKHSIERMKAPND